MPILTIQALDGGISSTDTVTKSSTPPTTLARTHPSNMTVVSNDPIFWPFIETQISFSYWIVAGGVVVVYDWVVTLGQEIELIWRQRWSLMTALYLVIRYIGMSYAVVNVLVNMPLVLVTDAGCNIMYYAVNGVDVVVAAMLGVIMIARLHAMYQRSKMVFIFLVVIFLAVNITCGVITAIGFSRIVMEENILSGMYVCGYDTEGDPLLVSMVWMLNTVWEVLAMCLSVWIAVRHFRDLRRHGLSTGSTIGDCFKVLLTSHVLYFSSFAGVSCLQLILLSQNSDSVGALILDDSLQVLSAVQMFVLGPRLILSVREYHATLVANSDAETSMNSIVFQDNVHVPTSSTV